jgi:uncharacterized protein with beta-barrel porin domain
MTSTRHSGHAAILRRLLLSSSALAATSLLAPTAAQAQSVIINDARVTTQNLDALLPPAQPPTAQVTGTGSVIVPTINGSAITAAAQAWTLANNGLLSADGITVKFDLGGTISNTGNINTNAAMQPGGTAIQIDGAPGTVTNSGTITGGNVRGIEMKKGGIVINQAGGSISAFGGAINITGGAGTVTNAGSISSSGFNGVVLYNGGLLTNQAGGSIFGSTSAAIVKSAGTVVNSGTMTGGSFADGIAFSNGGTLINNAGGIITSTSGSNAVSIIITPGLVDNAGTISDTAAGFATGVAIGGGTLTNRAGGTILGTYNAVWVNSANAGTIRNAGLIRSTAQDGIEIDPTNSIVTNSGTIVTTGAAAGIWMQKAGTITNSGTIGSGTGLAINFSGNNFANTLILQTGSTLNGNVQAGGGAAVDALIFQGTGTESANRFLAFETLEMNGTDWTLNGAGTFSTSSQITAGTLRINGTLTTPSMSVLGTLAGGGTVTGNVLAATGRVAPGSSITTLRVGGTLGMGAGSTFHVDLDPSSSSLVRVGGAVTLSGGQIDVTTAPGSYTAGTVYNVLHSDTSVTGTFANSTVAVGAFRFNVSYDPDDVFLTLTRLAFSEACASYNQCAVAGGLDRLGTGIVGDLANVVDTLGMLDIPGQQRALASMAGDMHPTLALLALDGHALFGQSVSRRLAERRNNGPQTASSGDGSYNVAMLGKPDGLVAASMPGGAPDALYGAWFRGYGAAGTLNGDINAAGANYFVGGAAMGIDRTFAPGLVAGLSFGYAATKADFNGSATSGRIDSYDIGLYGSYQWGGFHLDAVASYAFLNNKTDRQIMVGDIVRQANASYHGQRYGLMLETGYDFNLGGVMVKPTLGGQYVHLRQNAFHEDGAGGLDLDGKRSSTDSLRGSAGVRIGSQFMLGGIAIGPELRGRFEHEFLDNRVSTDVNFAGQPAAGAFTVIGAKVPRNSVILGGGLAALITPWTSAFIDYDYKFNKDQKIHNLTAGVRFEF